MSGALLSSSAVVALAAIPRPVLWSYSVGGLVLLLGLAATLLRGEWRQKQGLDKLIPLGPLFYAAPLAAFGTQHFTLTKVIASIVPSWMPWHQFWAYFVGACFIAAALSVVTNIGASLAASLLALTFFLFVVLMDLPAWVRNPGSRIALTLALRQLAFSGGALALVVGLAARRPEPRGRRLATVARYFVAVPVLFFSVGQFLHGDLLPGVPLVATTPEWILGHAIWTYLVAVVYAVTGVLLLVNRRARTAALWLGATVLVVELAVYLPVAVTLRMSLGLGFNYPADTLMFCGAALLLAGALPAESERQATSTR